MNKIIFLLLIISLVSPIYSELVDGLVGYWGFEEGSGSIAYNTAQDSSHGTMQNGAYWSSDSRIGNYALSLDGQNDYVKVPMLQEMKTLNKLSIAMWFKWEQGNVGLWHDLISSAYPGNNQFWFRIKDDGTEFSMYTNNGGTIIASVIPTQNTWHHTVFTYDDATMESKIYLDGELVGSSSIIAFPDTTDANFSIGRYITSETNLFHGNIDNIGIWDRVLSGGANSEIEQLYTTNTAINVIPEPATIFLFICSFLGLFVKIGKS